MPTGADEELHRLGEEFLDGMEGKPAKNIPEVQAHIAELTEQRDALLAACKAARLYGNQGETPDGRSVDTMLRAAIARATGDTTTED